MMHAPASHPPLQADGHPPSLAASIEASTGASVAASGVEPSTAASGPPSPLLLPLLPPDEVLPFPASGVFAASPSIFWPTAEMPHAAPMARSTIATSSPRRD